MCRYLIERPKTRAKQRMNRFDGNASFSVGRILEDPRTFASSFGRFGGSARRSVILGRLSLSSWFVHRNIYAYMPYYIITSFEINYLSIFCGI